MNSKMMTEGFAFLLDDGFKHSSEMTKEELIHVVNYLMRQHESDMAQREKDDEYDKLLYEAYHRRGFLGRLFG